MKKRTPSSPVQAPASTTDENNLKPGEGEQNSTSRNIEALQAIAPNVMVEIGRVISHIGTAGFFLATQQLVDSTVAIDGMHVSVWKVDAHARRFIDGAPLYGSELVDAGIRKGLPEGLITQLVDQQGPQLIRLQPEAEGSSDLLPPAHRCLIAMRQPDSLLIVLLQRNIDSDDFSPNELAALEELSLVLLPLVEQHASL